MSASAAPSRRERLRAQTLGEIKENALAQIAEGGPGALSLNAIARSMGMSGPALYRYFDSRDDLLASLVADAYDDLAGSLEAAAEGARRRAAVGRFQTVVAAFRTWALADPHRYRLIFSTTYGSGLVAPQLTIPRAHRAMETVFAAVADLLPPSDRPGGKPTALDLQLRSWAESRSSSSDLPPRALRLGILVWTRLHGVISLEIEGVFAAMGIDAALLYDAEVAELQSLGTAQA